MLLEKTIVAVLHEKAWMSFFKLFFIRSHKKFKKTTTTTAAAVVVRNLNKYNPDKLFTAMYYNNLQKMSEFHTLLLLENKMELVIL